MVVFVPRFLVTILTISLSPMAYAALDFDSSTDSSAAAPGYRAATPVLEFESRSTSQDSGKLVQNGRITPTESNRSTSQDTEEQTRQEAAADDRRTPVAPGTPGGQGIPLQKTMQTPCPPKVRYNPPAQRYRNKNPFVRSGTQFRMPRSIVMATIIDPSRTRIDPFQTLYNQHNPESLQCIDQPDDPNPMQTLHRRHNHAGREWTGHASSQQKAEEWNDSHEAREENLRHTFPHAQHHPQSERDAPMAGPPRGMCGTEQTFHNPHDLTTFRNKSAHQQARHAEAWPNNRPIPHGTKLMFD